MREATAAGGEFAWSKPDMVRPAHLSDGKPPRLQARQSGPKWATAACARVTKVASRAAGCRAKAFPKRVDLPLPGR